MQDYIEIGPVVSGCIDSKSLNNFQSVSPKNQSCEIWLKLAQWFRRRCCLKKLWTDGQTGDDGR